MQYFLTRLVRNLEIMSKMCSQSVYREDCTRPDVAMTLELKTYLMAVTLTTRNYITENFPFVTIFSLYSTRTSYNDDVNE